MAELTSKSNETRGPNITHRLGAAAMRALESAKLALAAKQREAPQVVSADTQEAAAGTIDLSPRLSKLPPLRQLRARVGFDGKKSAVGELPIENPAMHLCTIAVPRDQADHALRTLKTQSDQGHAALLPCLRETIGDVGNEHEIFMVLAPAENISSLSENIAGYGGRLNTCILDYSSDNPVFEPTMVVLPKSGALITLSPQTASREFLEGDATTARNARPAFTTGTKPPSFDMDISTIEQTPVSLGEFSQSNATTPASVGHAESLREPNIPLGATSVCVVDVRPLVGCLSDSAEVTNFVRVLESIDALTPYVQFRTSVFGRIVIFFSAQRGTAEAVEYGKVFEALGLGSHIFTTKVVSDDEGATKIEEKLPMPQYGEDAPPPVAAMKRGLASSVNAGTTREGSYFEVETDDSFGMTHEGEGDYAEILHVRSRVRPWAGIGPQAYEEDPEFPLIALKEKIDHEHIRVVSLQGPGGIGKSRRIFAALNDMTGTHLFLAFRGTENNVQSLGTARIVTDLAEQFSEIFPDEHKAPDVVRRLMGFARKLTSNTDGTQCLPNERAELIKMMQSEDIEELVVEAMLAVTGNSAVEDLHFADDESMTFIQNVGRKYAERSMGRKDHTLIVTYRGEDVNRRAMDDFTKGVKSPIGQRARVTYYEEEVHGRDFTDPERARRYCLSCLQNFRTSETPATTLQSVGDFCFAQDGRLFWKESDDKTVEIPVDKITFGDWPQLFGSKAAEPGKEKEGVPFIPADLTFRAHEADAFTIQAVGDGSFQIVLDQGFEDDVKKVETTSDYGNLLADRLRRLGDDEYNVALCMAVTGGASMTPEQIADIAAQQDFARPGEEAKKIPRERALEIVKELIAKKFLAPESPSKPALTFAHDTIRSYLISSMDEATRIALPLRSAKLLNKTASKQQLIGMLNLVATGRRTPPLESGFWGQYETVYSAAQGEATMMRSYDARFSMARETLTAPSIREAIAQLSSKPLAAEVAALPIMRTAVDALFTAAEVGTMLGNIEQAKSSLGILHAIAAHNPEFAHRTRVLLADFERATSEKGLALGQANVFGQMNALYTQLSLEASGGDVTKFSVGAFKEIFRRLNATQPTAARAVAEGLKPLFAQFAKTRESAGAESSTRSLVSRLRDVRHIPIEPSVEEALVDAVKNFLTTPCAQADQDALRSSLGSSLAGIDMDETLRKRVVGVMQGCALAATTFPFEAIEAKLSELLSANGVNKAAETARTTVDELRMWQHGQVESGIKKSGDRQFATRAALVSLRHAYRNGEECGNGEHSPTDPVDPSARHRWLGHIDSIYAGVADSVAQTTTTADALAEIEEPTKRLEVEAHFGPQLTQSALVEIMHAITHFENARWDTKIVGKPGEWKKIDDDHEHDVAYIQKNKPEAMATLRELLPRAEKLHAMTQQLPGLLPPNDLIKLLDLCSLLAHYSERLPLAEERFSEGVRVGRRMREHAAVGHIAELYGKGRYGLSLRIGDEGGGGLDEKRTHLKSSLAAFEGVSMPEFGLVGNADANTRLRILSLTSIGDFLKSYNPANIKRLREGQAAHATAQRESPFARVSRAIQPYVEKGLIWLMQLGEAPSDEYVYYTSHALKPILEMAEALWGNAIPPSVQSKLPGGDIRTLSALRQKSSYLNPTNLRGAITFGNKYAPTPLQRQRIANLEALAA